MSGPYISSIAYELGELVPIAELDELRADPVALQSFRALGLERYSRAACTPPELARVAARGTLARSGVAPEDIDLLVYASDTPPLGRYYGEDIRMLCSELGLRNAYPLGLFLSECANVHVAIRLACDWIQGGRAARVLVICADTGVEGYSRVWPNVTVLSDGSSAFLVTKDPPADGFEILATAHYTNPSVWQIDRSTQLLEYFKGVVHGVKKVSAEVLERGGLRGDEVRRVIVSNYNSSVIRTFVSQMGYTLQQVYLANLPRFAHTYASDSMINLNDAATDRWIEPGEPVLVLGSATVTWGASLLRRR